ncbi:hypothetical protein JCM10908_002858 [Rhodotorula pacifica]|uniref:DUF6534 domain-containing protein n=1 Tax=Rhodotorula pacifica TaxID=1495444 RepID=UPI00316D8B1E
MAEPEDIPAMIAPQAVATAILAPYIAGLLTNCVLIGAFLILFGRYVANGDLAKHGLAGRISIWTVFGLVICCLGVSYEEIIDTGISQKRSSEEVFNGPPQSNILPFLSGTTAAVCQTFLAARAGSLMKNRVRRYAFLGFTCVLTLVGLAGSVLFSAAGFELSKYGTNFVDYKVCQAIWLWASAAVDLLISLALACTLHGRIAHFNEVTDSLLKRLIITSLQTAAYTSVISIIGAIISTAFAHSSDFRTASAGFAFWSPLPALHAISLYTTLSTRRTISDTLSGSGQNGSGLGVRSGGGVSNSAAHTGQAVKLATFKRGKSFGGSSYSGAPTYGLQNKRDSPPPLQVSVQQEQSVSFDVRSEYDEEYGLEKSRL